MKKLFLSLLCVLAPILVFSQANKWIVYSQNYYKIKVVKDGIYRLDSATLAAAGIPLAFVKPQNFQLFFHGQEQYIYIRGERDSVFNGPKSGNDYIEFYGQHNIGALPNDLVASDSMLYVGITSYPDNPIANVPNPYYSMFNDTSTYYLTWNGSLTNRRMKAAVNDTTFSSNTAFPYFTAQSDTIGKSYYCAGARHPVGGEDVNDSRYTYATGWFFPEISMGGTQTISLTGVKNIYASGPTAYVSTFFEGQSTIAPNDHEIKVSASWASGYITDTIFTAFTTFLEKYNVPASKLAGSSPSISFYSAPVPAAASSGNLSAVSYVFVQYPHTSNLGGASNFMMFVKDTTSAAKTYLNLTNLNVGAGDTVRLYDMTNHSRYIVTQQAGFKVLMPNTPNTTRQCYITADAQVNKVAKLIPVGMNGNGRFTSFNSTYKSAYIIIYPSIFEPEANAYASYRQNKYGTNVVFANIEELYDQFCYGIVKDPLAIRNFCSYILSKSAVNAPPAGLFLLGKAIHSNLYRQDTGNYNATLVPSFGYPSSDMLLTAGLNPAFGSTSVEAAIPTGRLPAINGTEVITYLNKVKTYEGNTPALWMKNIIHFAGGNSGPEHNAIMSYLGVDSAYAEGVYLGANVYTIQKTSTSPIQITLSDSIAGLINNGVALMTFFGHASGTNFDINLDAPSDYNNVGKYPMILALACLSGDMYEPAGGAISSTSEQFVLDQKGSIGFVAMDALGELFHLGTYSQLLYKNFSTTLYGNTMGSCIQKTAGSVQNLSPNDRAYYDIALQMQLDGDPAITIAPNDSLPDYAVTDTSLTFIPSNVTTQIDSFKVQLSILNLAKAINQPVQIEIDRILPGNNSVVTRNITLNNIYYRRDTILTYPVDKINGVGMNYFSVKVDPASLLKEITKSNNDVSKINLLITSGDILPIYPYNFAIIPKDTATLKASTGDPFASAHNYVFQVDTTINFNSGFLKSMVINAKGGVVRAPWNAWVSTPFAPPIITSPTKGTVQLILKDSTVYYWRVRRDTSDIKDYGWQNSSFQYIRGKSGWGQSHYYQFENNQYTYLQQNINHRDWVFNPTGKTLTATTVGLPLGPYQPSAFSSGAFATGYTLDLLTGASNSCTPTPAFNLAVIDAVSLTPWSTQNYKFSNDNSSDSSACVYPDGRFLFWYNDPKAINGLEYVLNGNTIPNGDYILMYSFRESMLKSAPVALKNELIALGADAKKINTASDSVPWLFFVQKGNLASARTFIGANPTATLTFDTNLSNNNSFGSMVSPIIGPAQKWDSISWRQHPLVKNAVDSVRLNINTIDVNGNSSVLVKGIAPAVANMYVSSVNPKQYPYLQFMLYTKDAVTHTPAQMNKWQVFYTPVPEVAVNPSVYYSFYKDTLYGGDTVRFKTVVQNVGDYAMDSMQVNSWVVDPNGSSHYITGIKPTKKLNPGDTTMISARTSSNQYSGSNNIWLEVNPPYLPKTRPEEYYFNNYVRKTFVAEGNKNSPLLDVTFDGLHILNNDIVSPHPNILMELTSNNKFLALNYSDTGKFAVYIRNINNPVPQRIYFNQLQFTPAVLPDNRCKVQYEPTLGDGTYELTVQAADQSGNLAASNSYKVDFVVVTKSTITNILNYPNPFSTSTRFVFTITGDQLPTYFKIQIMTITGKVVREITENELGTLHIGRNITQYAWDGTDQFGSKLANGVYLYKVTTSIDNQSIDHMATEADSYFTKGWGKMYIIR